MSSPTAPTVSFILPCARGSNGVLHTLASLAELQRRDIEVVLVLESPLPEAWTQRLPMPVTTLDLPDFSQAEAKNQAIQASRGSYLRMLSPGVRCLAAPLAEQIAVLDADSHAGAVYGMIAANTSPEAPILQQTTQATWRYADWLVEQSPRLEAALLRRECINDIGMFNQSLPLYHDVEFWLRLARFSRIAASNHVATLAESESPRNVPAHANELGDILRAAVLRWGSQNPDGTKVSPIEVNHRIARTEYEFGQQQWKVGNRHSAARAFRAAYAGGYKPLQSIANWILTLAAPSRG